MDPNQNPPSEREWTPEEQEKFLKDLGDGVFSGIVANNSSYPSASLSSEPITLDGLIEMKRKLDEQFPEPVKFKKGADMSGETWNVLKQSLPTMVSKDDPHMNPLVDISIHIRPDIPFGEVRECACEQYHKIHFTPLDPLPPAYPPSVMEFEQEMTIEEAKKRFPGAKIEANEKQNQNH